MVHRLTPTAKAASRSLPQLLASLREAFPIVEADQERGRDHVGEMIAQFLKIKAGYVRWKNPPPQASEIDSMIERLDRLRDHSAYVIVAESETDEDNCIAFNLIPGEEIIVGYANQKHQDTASPITLRVADALGYDIAEL